MSFLLLFACDISPVAKNDPELQSYFEDIYFEDIFVYTIHKRDFSVKPFYPYSGTPLSGPYRQIVADCLNQYLHEGITIFGTYRFFFTPRLEAYLVRVENPTDAKSQTIYCLIYDHLTGRFVKTIELATQFEYEGVLGRKESLVRDIDKDGILDLLVHVRSEHHTQDDIITKDSLLVSLINDTLPLDLIRFNYENLRRELGIYSPFRSLTHKEMLSLAEEISVKAGSGSRPSTGKWVIVLEDYNSVNQAGQAQEAYQTAIRLKGDLKYGLGDAPVRIYQIDKKFVVAIDEFGSENFAALATKEAKAGIAPKAELVKVSSFCEQWNYECNGVCMYTCN